MSEQPKPIYPTGIHVATRDEQKPMLKIIGKMLKPPVRLKAKGRATGIVRSQAVHFSHHHKTNKPKFY